MFELLNDDMTVMTTLGLQDFLGVYREQKGVSGQRAVADS
jgi:hypothetical protein